MENKLVFTFSACYVFILISNVLYAYRFADERWADKPIEGRYTREVSDYQLLVPRKVDHEGSFISYTLPNFFHQDHKRRRRDARVDDEKVHYGIHFDGHDHVVELWPNHGLLSPGFVVETRTSGSATDLNKLKIRSVDNTQCHYFGRIKGQDDSRVALSLCSGISGHIRTKRDYFFIEPVNGHEPKENGKHLHVIYKRSADSTEKQTCGTKMNWEAAWSNRLEAEYRQRNGPDTDLRADFAKRISMLRGKQDNYLHKRSDEKRYYYMETLVVADKKFLQARNGSDYEQYLFTIVNMAADIFHDDSIGHPFDLTLVRVIYLEKEEEEIDLTINIDADTTLTSFCKWSTRINPISTHPNHHDIAILVTKHDLCAGSDDCGAVGLANIAGCCQKGQSCAVCEDTGLVVGTIMAHEVGHLLGCEHDSDDDNVAPPECPGAVGKNDIHVMASWSQVSPANWSTCSREAITHFLQHDLGGCLLEEPQDHDFKFPQMPPGVVYDREWQCRDYYGPTKPCNLGPDKNCVLLSCKPTGSKKCKTKGPPADGTSCGNNKWCFENKCVEIGVRPGAINGEWGDWGAWSGCSRSCGGGAQYKERKCDNPRPANSGRYCVGKSRSYQLCNKDSCNTNLTLTFTFREAQCKNYSKDGVTWKPFNDGNVEHACKLMCLSSTNVVKTLAKRVQDGTSCKRGTKNKCIAGKCRNVGCDLVLDSDAVEDICGKCNGNATTCEIVSGVFREAGKDHQKIVDIPIGARQITVEEMKASNNFIAVSSGDGKKIYLDATKGIDGKGEDKIGGSISAYRNEEPNREFLYIAGPTTENLSLYIVHSSDPNPGINYRYSKPTESSYYKPKLSWELVSWSTCSAFCGGGTQFSEPSCIEEKGGRVSNINCKELPKPEMTTRACNQQSCRIKWRTGEWGKCSGCKNKPGTKRRVVDCVKQSPFDDTEIIIEDYECKKDKPSGEDHCTSKLPCPSSKRQVPLQEESADHEELASFGSRKDCHQNSRKSKPSGKQTNCKTASRNNDCCCEENEEENEEEEDCDDEEKDSEEKENKKDGSGKTKSFHKSDDDDDKNTNKKKPFHKEEEKKTEITTTRRPVTDILNSEKFKILEIPMTEDANNITFSDEAYENVAGNIPSKMDMTKMEEKKGNEAQRILQKSKKENIDKHESEDDDNDDEYMQREVDREDHSKDNKDVNKNEDGLMNEDEYEHMNGNKYEHMNGNENMNGNEYEHMNGNENMNGNEYEHMNGNEYEQMNGNEYEHMNGNEYEHMNGNENMNGNEYEHVNGNENMNGNEYEHMNGNENQNEYQY
jgi:hypothetical protein